MPERPPDPQLEASTNRWMTAGVVLLALMALAFPIYRITEPDLRQDARAERLIGLTDQGSQIFAVNCVPCHGAEGLGSVAPALNSRQFLTAASDEQIALLIATGVPGTAMAAYSLDFGGPLTLEQIDALTAYLRSLEETAPDNPDWRGPAG